MRKDLKELGYTDKEINTKIAKHIGGQLTWASLGGFISGGVMGAGAGITSYSGNKNVGTSIKKSDSVDDLLNTVKLAPMDSEAYSLYKEYTSNNKTNLTNAQIGNLYNSLIGDAKTVLSSKTSTSEQKSNALSVLSKLNEIIQREAVDVQIEKYENSTESDLDIDTETENYYNNNRGDINGISEEGRFREDRQEMQENFNENTGRNSQYGTYGQQIEEYDSAGTLGTVQQTGQRGRILLNSGNNSKLLKPNKSNINRNEKSVNPKMLNILQRLSRGEDVSLEEIEANPDIIKAREHSNNIKETININTTERINLRKQITDELLNSGSYSGVDNAGKDVYNGIIKQNYRIDIVIGPPAAGKSSVLVNPLSQQYGSRVIDSDMAKELLPEFNNGLGANAVHEESKTIIADVLTTSILNGDNLVYPIVGGNIDSLINDINTFKAQGYGVHLHLNELNINKSLGRAINRFYETGRFIPPKVILSYGNKPLENFNKIIKIEGLLDGYSHYSNDVERGQAPILISQENEGLQLLQGLRRNDNGFSQRASGTVQITTRKQINGDNKTDSQESVFSFNEAEIIADSPLLTAPQLSVDTVDESAISKGSAGNSGLTEFNNSAAASSNPSKIHRVAVDKNHTRQNSKINETTNSADIDSISQSETSVNNNDMQESGNNSKLTKPDSDLYNASKNIMPSNKNKIKRSKLTLAEKQTVKRFGEALGFEVEFFNAKQFLEEYNKGRSEENKLKVEPEAYTSGKTLYLAESCNNPIAFLLAHEFTDSVAMRYIIKNEKGEIVLNKQYKKLIDYMLKRKAFLDYAKSKKCDTAERLIWKTVAGRQAVGDSNFVGKSSDEARVQATIELLSDFVGEKLTTDIDSLIDFANNMNAQQRNAFVISMIKVNTIE